MKIYFDTTVYDECTSKCPHGIDCMVGSIYCSQCKHCMYVRDREEMALFFIGDKKEARGANYVECTHDGDVNIWKMIKRFFYKFIIY